MPEVLAAVAKEAKINVSKHATLSMSVETVAETERLWKALGFTKDYPMKQKLAIMAHTFEIEVGWGWPWSVQLCPPIMMSHRNARTSA